MTEHDEPGGATSLLQTPAIVAYVEEAFRSENAAIIVDALRVVVEAQGGVLRLSKKSGLNEQAVRAALKQTSTPDFSAILILLRSLGVGLTVTVSAS